MSRGSGCSSTGIADAAFFVRSAPVDLMMKRQIHCADSIWWMAALQVGPFGVVWIVIWDNRPISVFVISPSPNAVVKLICPSYMPVSSASQFLVLPVLHSVRQRDMTCTVSGPHANYLQSAYIFFRCYLNAIQILSAATSVYDVHAQFSSP